jgi:hypothetical protein
MHRNEHTRMFLPIYTPDWDLYDILFESGYRSRIPVQFWSVCVYAYNMPKKCHSN